MKTIRTHHKSYGITTYTGTNDARLNTCRINRYYVNKTSAFYCANGDNLKVSRTEAANLLRSWRKKDRKRVANSQTRPIDRAAYLVRDIMAHTPQI